MRAYLSITASSISLASHIFLPFLLVYTASALAGPTDQARALEVAQQTIARLQLELESCRGQLDRSTSSLAFYRQNSKIDAPNGEYTAEVLAGRKFQAFPGSQTVPQLEVRQVRQASTKLLCNLSTANFSLAANLQLGSNGVLVSSLTVPPGGETASVSAVPLDNTVSVGTKISGEWSGTAVLPKTGKWLVSLTVGSEKCDKATEVDVVCMDRFERNSMTGQCKASCTGTEVRTDSGACKPPAILATVLSDSKVVELHKQNDDLEGIPKSAPVRLEVKPSADYAVNMTYELHSGDAGSPAWVSFSGLQGIGSSKYEKTGEVIYNLSPRSVYLHH